MKNITHEYIWITILILSFLFLILKNMFKIERCKKCGNKYSDIVNRSGSQIFLQCPKCGDIEVVEIKREVEK